MKHSIKPYSKDISEVQRAFYKSTKDFLIPAWCIKEKWKLNAKDAPRLHISHERNESENIPILVEEIGDAFRGIPKLRRLSLLEYLLGVPRASSRVDSNSQKSHIFQKNLRKFLSRLDFVWYGYSAILKTRKKQKLAPGSRLIG